MSSESYKIEDQHAVYFLTFTVTDWVDVYTRPDYNKIILEGLSYCRANKGLKLYAWCLMSNHLHLVCQTEHPFKLSDFVRDFKQFTAKKTLATIQEIPESRQDWMLYRFEYAGKYDNRITKYRFWQDTNHPILLYNNFEYFLVTSFLIGAKK
jgi:REP element-mobilizing transposase RayT